MIKGNSNQINEFHRKKKIAILKTQISLYQEARSSLSYQSFHSKRKRQHLFHTHLYLLELRPVIVKFDSYRLLLPHFIAIFHDNRGGGMAVSGQRREPLSCADLPAREQEQHPRLGMLEAAGSFKEAPRAPTEALLLFPALSMDQQGAIPHQREALGLVLAPA